MNADEEDQGGQPSEEELRAAYEAEMSRISSADMILQATVSLLNIGGFRLGLGAAAGGAEPERAGSSAGEGTARDLEQVRDAIDAARALLPILERRRPGELRPLRDALSQLQMAYAREAGPAAGAAAAATGPEPGAPGAPGASGAPPQSPSPPQSPPPSQQSSSDADAATAGERKPAGPGPAESSGRLWVPGR